MYFINRQWDIRCVGLSREHCRLAKKNCFDLGISLYDYRNMVGEFKRVYFVNVKSSRQLNSAGPTYPLSSSWWRAAASAASGAKPAAYRGIDLFRANVATCHALARLIGILSFKFRLCCLRVHRTFVRCSWTTRHVTP